MSGEFNSQSIIAGLILEGWEIVKDVAPSEFQVKDLEFISFLEQGDTCIEGDCIEGEKMRQRAVDLKANLGFVDGMRILERHDEIPVEMQDKVIVLTGTLLSCPGGGLVVAFLCWFVVDWALCFCRLERGWYGVCRLPRCKPR